MPFFNVSVSFDRESRWSHDSEFGYYKQCRNSDSYEQNIMSYALPTHMSVCLRILVRLVWLPVSSVR